MNFLKITDTFKKVAQQYRADTKVASDYIHERNLINQMRGNGIETDARDFLPMVMIMGVQGNTPEERAADIRSKIDELVEAFSDKDHTRRTPYLDTMFDLVDNFDLANVDMDDEIEVGKMIQSLLMDQAFGQKRDENPEYFSNRYTTIEASALVNAQDAFRTTAGPYINYNLKKIGTAPFTISSLPQRHPLIGDNLQYARTAFAKKQVDDARALKNGAPRSDTLEIPVLDAMIPFAGKNIADVPSYGKENQTEVELYWPLLIEERLIQLKDKSFEGYKEAGIVSSQQTLYVDGMPYVDFVKKHFPKLDANDALNGKLLGTILLNEQHQVDIVHAYRNDEGVMQYEAKTLKASLTPEQQAQKQQEQDAYVKQFSWFRRTFFNWGPFRILPPPVDPNSPEAEARRASICNHQKDILETRIEQRQEEAREQARKDALKEQQKEARTRAIDQEKQRFDQSVELWDKDSVIGILGQQVKGSYDTIGHALAKYQKNEQYGQVADVLAKQVLYSQLMLERALSKDGQPGPIEAALKGDGTQETIEKNIAGSVKTIAEDKLLKDLFLRKAGDGTRLLGNRFMDMILHGGAQHFAMDYTKLRNEAEIRNQQNAPEAEMDMKKEAAVPGLQK